MKRRDVGQQEKRPTETFPIKHDETMIKQTVFKRLWKRGKERSSCLGSLLQEDGSATAKTSVQCHRSPESTREGRNPKKKHNLLGNYAF